MSLTNFGGLFLPLFILILHWLSDEGVLATHFRGGIIMVRPVDGGALAEVSNYIRILPRHSRGCKIVPGKFMRVPRGRNPTVYT